jgi:hypothetical protein
VSLCASLPVTGTLRDRITLDIDPQLLGMFFQITTTKESAHFFLSLENDTTEARC